MNFSYLAQEGQLAGLRPVYYGYQRALQSATPVTLNALPLHVDQQGFAPAP